MLGGAHRPFIYGPQVGQPGWALRGGITAGVALGLLLGSGVGWAFECKTPDARPDLSLYWGQRSLEYGIQASAAVDPEVVRAAFDVWATPECSDLAFSYVGLVAVSDPVSQVRAVDSGWQAGGRAWEAVAITETSFRPSTGTIERAVIEVNEENFEFADVQAACATGQYDQQAVLTHEVGHFLGLGHTTVFEGLPSDPTMAPRVAVCEADKRSLEDDDLAGLCFLYPAGAPTGRCGGLADRASYVANEPFGCTNAPFGPEASVWLGLWGLICAVVRRRHGLRPLR